MVVVTVGVLAFVILPGGPPLVVTPLGSLPGLALGDVAFPGAVALVSDVAAPPAAALFVCDGLAGGLPRPAARIALKGPVGFGVERVAGGVGVAAAPGVPPGPIRHQPHRPLLRSSLRGRSALVAAGHRSTSSRGWPARQDGEVFRDASVSRA